MLIGLGMNVAAGPAPRIKRTKVGDKFSTTVAEPDNERDIRTKNWTVKEVYPHVVLAVSSTGERKCFDYGLLVTLGKEDSNDKSGEYLPGCEL